MIPTQRILVGDVREQLRLLPDASVHCVITSPPYYGLRTYKTPPQTWGGDPDHAHDFAPTEFCSCEAWLGELGLEPTVALYLEHMLEVFAEIWRVLRDDGTLWLNMGDTMKTDSPVRSSGAENFSKEWDPTQTASRGGRRRSAAREPGLKNKDLMLVPAELALALRWQGWYLRSEIVWAKVAPMPESATDRPTRSHEMIYLLTKKPRYFYDRFGYMEPVTGGTHGRGTKQSPPKTMANADGTEGIRANRSYLDAISKHEVTDRYTRDVWFLSTEPSSAEHYAAFPREIPRRCIQLATSAHGVCANCGAQWIRFTDRDVVAGSWHDHTETLEKVHRNKSGKGSQRYRDVYEQPEFREWVPGCECSTGEPFKPGDFDIIRTRILKESEYADRRLEEGRRGLTDTFGDGDHRAMLRYQQRRYAEQLRQSPFRVEMRNEAGSAFDHYIRTDRTAARPVPPELLDAWIQRGWVTRVPRPVPSPYPVVPATVLDPFGGSGTVLVVCDELNRNGVMIDLSVKYAKMAKKRIEDTYHEYEQLAITDLRPQRPLAPRVTLET